MKAGGDRKKNGYKIILRLSRYYRSWPVNGSAGVLSCLLIERKDGFDVSLFSAPVILAILQESKNALTEI